jgi:hypothetical protein
MEACDAHGAQGGGEQAQILLDCMPIPRFFYGLFQSMHSKFLAGINLIFWRGVVSSYLLFINF